MFQTRHNYHTKILQNKIAQPIINKGGKSTLEKETSNEKKQTDSQLEFPESLAHKCKWLKVNRIYINTEEKFI